jgi:HEPN domain-containing protein
MREAAQVWIKLAELDLAACKRLIGDDHLTQIVAFHAQQCFEKLFKAILEDREESIPRTHDLHRLHQLAMGGFPKTVHLDRKLLDELSTIYLDSRYPSDLGLLPSGRPTAQDAQRYLESIQSFYNALAE